MRSIFNLEYSILDKIGRAKKTTHVGIFDSIDTIEKAKSDIASRINDKLSFTVHIINEPL